MPIPGFSIVLPAQTTPAESAPAQEGVPADGPPPPAPPALLGFMPMILLFVIMYLLIIRPQQKRQKEQRELVSRLKAGDRVLTSGGIYGTITGVRDDEVTVEIAKGVEIRILRNAIGKQVDDRNKV